MDWYGHPPFGLRIVEDVMAATDSVKNKPVIEKEGNDLPSA